jgi:hypothetical protein
VRRMHVAADRPRPYGSGLSKLWVRNAFGRSAAAIAPGGLQPRDTHPSSVGASSRRIFASFHAI